VGPHLIDTESCTGKVDWFPSVVNDGRQRHQDVFEFARHLHLPYFKKNPHLCGPHFKPHESNNIKSRRGDKETPSHQRFCWDAGERNVEPLFSCPGAENLLLGDSPLPAPVNEAASDAACSRQRATGHRPEPLREDWLVTLARGAFRPIDPLRGGPCFHNLSPGCGGSAGETHR
jgi:hypothetical protein